MWNGTSQVLTEYHVYPLRSREIKGSLMGKLKPEWWIFLVYLLPPPHTSDRCLKWTGSGSLIWWLGYYSFKEVTVWNSCGWTFWTSVISYNTLEHASDPQSSDEDRAWILDQTLGTRELEIYGALVNSRKYLEHSVYSLNNFSKKEVEQKERKVKGS